MSSPLFSITEHVIPCQYIREYPHAIKDKGGQLQLAIKEYRPLDTSSLTATSPTIIGAHANGFPKETYEPLFEELQKACRVKIRSIWIADSSHQGASGVLNEHVQGDDPSWLDHSRDLLCMVNHFQGRMPRPIIGIGHSMGSAQLVQLSILHPSLLHSLALLEPIIQLDPPPGPQAGLPSSLRKDLWSSRREAEASFRKSRFFRTFDSRVLDNLLRFGIRETPTALYPEPGSLTLTTSKHQEAWSYGRSNYVPISDERVERAVNPNLSVENREYLIHCPDMVTTFNNLPHVRPGVLWMFGSKSHINKDSASQDEKLARTGTAVGGSGGPAVGRIQKHVVNATHMLPFEKVEECASLLAVWLEEQIQDFEESETFWQEWDSKRSENRQMSTSKEWLENMRQSPWQKKTAKPRL